MNVSHFSIGHLNVKKQVIEFYAITDLQSEIEETTVALDEDRFSVLCIDQKKVIRIHDLKKEYPQYFEGIHKRYADGYSSALYLPLVSMEDATTGILVVKSIHSNSYSDIHLNTLKNLAAYIGIAFENATIYKSIEAQSELLAKQSQKLEDLDKLKTRFFLNISHEFRTPLTLIVTPLEQMLSEGSLNDWGRMHRQLAIMHKNAKQLLILINELLEIRNIESSGTLRLQATEFDLVSFTKSVINCFEELANQLNIQTSLKAEPTKIQVWFDPDIMQKVLTNLYSNAFKYTPKGGSIITSLDIQSTESADLVRITISDNGVGIAENEIPFVFERFYQGDAPINPIQQSSGIGLSLIKDLLQLHSGKIEIESVKDNGTTFFISIPLGRGHLKAEQINSKTLSRFQEGQIQSTNEDLYVDDSSIESDIQIQLPQVLIVEDNPDVLEFLRMELETEFAILEATDGKQGAELCMKQIPDLVLSDVMMPIMDGVAMCGLLKTDEKTSHIPIILLTAKSGEDSQIKGLNTGADDYIPKPFNVKILKARIHNLINSRKKLHDHFSSIEKVKVKDVIENKQDRSFIERIDSYIHLQIKNPELNHELLTKEIGMSKTQLYRKLQAITGKTVHEYIRNYRLRMAHELLLDKPELLVFEVAYEVGFKDPAYFSKSFFAFYKLWPNSLKRN